MKKKTPKQKNKLDGSLHIRARNRMRFYCARLRSAAASLSALMLPQRGFSHAWVAFACAASPPGPSLGLATTLILLRALS
jgi:hypothetical protein